MTNAEKLKQLYAEFGEFKPEFYVDLDGVLANFEKKALEVAGQVPERGIATPEHKKLRNDFWKAITAHVKSGKKFFEVLEPMDDAYQLIAYLKPYGFKICSATGHTLNAGEEKRSWVRKYLGNDKANEALFVRDAALKGTHAAPGRILIDDTRKAIDGWIAAGGIGIFHTSAANTIAQLKEMGL